MNKLRVDKEFLDNFTISKVKDYEGCPDALKMLYKRYGDEVDTLSKRKDDVIKLINEDNKPHWAINFMLNMLKENYKMDFYESYIIAAIDNLQDDSLIQECKSIFNVIKNSKAEDYESKLLTLEVKIAALESVQSYMNIESDIMMKHYQISICQSLESLLRDEEKTFTRSMNHALFKISEAQSVLDLDNSRNNIKFKAVALAMVDYLGLFEN